MAASLKSAECWNDKIIRGIRVILISLGEFCQLSKNQHYLAHICEKFGRCCLRLCRLDGRVGLTVHGPRSSLCHLWQSVPRSTQRPSSPCGSSWSLLDGKKQGVGLCLCPDAVWSSQARFVNAATSLVTLSTCSLSVTFFLFSRPPDNPSIQ